MAQGTFTDPLAFRLAGETPQRATDLQVLGVLAYSQVGSHCNMSTIKP